MIVNSNKKIGTWKIELTLENNFIEEKNNPIGLAIKE